MGLLSRLFSTKRINNQNTISNSDITQIKLEEITAHMDSSEGWNDIFLTIVNDIITTDNYHIYIGKGLYKGTIVGLKFEVKNDMPAGLLKSGEINKGGFISNGIKIISIGEESDKFIKVLSELYNFPTVKPFSKSVIPSTTFSLNQKVVDLDEIDYYKFKLFFGENSENLYSEMFFNIDLTKRIIELNEKDQGYRENIIKVFTT